MTTTTTDRTKTKSQRPEWKLRLGVLNIACWKNSVQSTMSEREFFTFSVQRSFKDKQGAWQNTPSLRQRDLLPMARLLERAFDKACQKAAD